MFERGHVLLLGWNAHAGVIVRELGRTGERMRLVIVADKDRETIEESVREQPSAGSTGSTSSSVTEIRRRWRRCARPPRAAPAPW